MIRRVEAEPKLLRVVTRDVLESERGCGESRPYSAVVLAVVSANSQLECYHMHVKAPCSVKPACHVVRMSLLYIFISLHSHFRSFPCCIAAVVHV